MLVIPTHIYPTTCWQITFQVLEIFIWKCFKYVITTDRLYFVKKNSLCHSNMMSCNFCCVGTSFCRALSKLTLLCSLCSVVLEDILPTHLARLWYGPCCESWGSSALSQCLLPHCTVLWSGLSLDTKCVYKHIHLHMCWFPNTWKYF